MRTKDVHSLGKRLLSNLEKSDRLIELLEILKRAECIFIEQWKILYKEDEIDMEDIFSIFYKGSNDCEIQVKRLIIKNIDSVVCNRVETA